MSSAILKSICDMVEALEHPQFADVQPAGRRPAGRALPVCLDYEVKRTTVYAVPGGSFTAARLKRIILTLFKCADYTIPYLSGAALSNWRKISAAAPGGRKAGRAPVSICGESRYSRPCLKNVKTPKWESFDSSHFPASDEAGRKDRKITGTELSGFMLQFLKKHRKGLLL